MIRSFNTDKPFDRFVLEQLAGDEIAGFKASADVTPDMYDSLIATHFLRNGPDGTGESDGDPDEVRSDKLRVLEGTFHITMSSLLGITIQCARCHDHKFERVSQKEYYSLQAIFSPGYNLDKWRKPIDRSVAMATRACGHSAFTSSAMRSTPGPQATRLSSSLHSGQKRGAGMTWPQ